MSAMFSSEELEKIRQRHLMSLSSVHSELEAQEQEAISDLLAWIEALDKQGSELHRWLDRNPIDTIKSQLQRLWEPPEEPIRSARGERSELLFSIDVSEPTLAQDEWGFHMTSDFRKTVKALDKNLRGRVLDAITEICMKPMELRGDTVKPLTGELQGFWRYRLGDYRLIYHPDLKAHRIDLVTIGGRGHIYG